MRAVVLILGSCPIHPRSYDAPLGNWSGSGVNGPKPCRKLTTAKPQVESRRARKPARPTPYAATVLTSSSGTVIILRTWLPLQERPSSFAMPHLRASTLRTPQRRFDLFQVVFVMRGDLVKLGLQRPNACFTVDEFKVSAFVVVQTSLIDDARAD